MNERASEGNTTLSRYLLYRPTSTSYSVNKSAILSEKEELIEACLKTNYFGVGEHCSYTNRIYCCGVALRKNGVALRIRCGVACDLRSHRNCGPMRLRCGPHPQYCGRIT
ncbi:hypothetical protein QL285_079870 [Trifolium repens]|nr:hypothetical protein QL285_079870 [Trifolium repens]